MLIAAIFPKNIVGRKIFLGYWNFCFLYFSLFLHIKQYVTKKKQWYLISKKDIFELKQIPPCLKLNPCPHTHTHAHTHTKTNVSWWLCLCLHLRFVTLYGKPTLPKKKKVQMIIFEMRTMKHFFLNFCCCIYSYWLNFLWIVGICILFKLSLYIFNTC